MEHEIRRFKERLKTYRGKYTQSHIDRVSRGRSVINQIVRKFTKSIDYHTQSKKLVKKEADDTKALTELYRTTPLFTSEARIRVHSSSLGNISKNIIGAGLNGSSLNDWVQEWIQLSQLRNYYRQFMNKEPALDRSSSLEPMCTDSEWSSFDNTVEFAR